MGKVFPSKGCCSVPLTHEEQQAQKPLWLQMQEASKALLEAAIVMGDDPALTQRLFHGRASKAEIELYKASETFKRLTKRTGPVILVPVGK